MEKFTSLGTKMPAGRGVWLSMQDANEAILGQSINCQSHSIGKAGVQLTLRFDHWCWKQRSGKTENSTVVGSGPILIPGKSRCRRWRINVVLPVAREPHSTRVGRKLSLACWVLAHKQNHWCRCKIRILSTEWNRKMKNAFGSTLVAEWILPLGVCKLWRIELMKQMILLYR